MFSSHFDGSRVGIENMEKIKQKHDKLYLYNRYVADAKLDGIAKDLFEIMLLD